MAENDIDPKLLSALADALQRAATLSPDLTGAVRIEAWDLIWTVGGLGLVGIVYGHPQIADGRRALTSTLAALDLERGWALSRNRVYRLGRCGAAPLH